MSETKARLDYLDIAKCLTIILVIMGHVAGNVDDPFYRCVIYYFHMPLFFIVSGIVTKKRDVVYDKQHYIDFIKKNIYILLIPCLIWALVYSKFSWKNIPYILYGSWQTLGKAETLTSLWYLPCLFLARLWMELIVGLIDRYPKVNKNIILLVATIISFTLGFCLPQLELGYPFGLNISFVGLGFMIIGYANKGAVERFQSKGILFHVIKLIACLAIFIFGVTYEEKITLVLMCGSQYGNIALFLLNAISGVAVIFSISALITKKWNIDETNPFKNIILWIGKNTIGIFLIHKPLLQEIIVPIFTNLGMSTFDVKMAFLAMLIDLPLSCLIVHIINKYTPRLFGRLN